MLGERLRSKASYPVIYMFIVTFFFTVILVGLARGTRLRVEANRQIMFERAVLMAALPDEVKAATRLPEVHDIFMSRVETADASSGGAYRVMRAGNLEAYALPIEGQGFWDVIKGVIAIRPDKKTIVGIAFHEQKETPGLGAEITKPYFRRRFAGRKMASGERHMALVPVGAEIGENGVQVITGATQTCNRLEKIINQAIKNWHHSAPDSEETQE